MRGGRTLSLRLRLRFRLYVLFAEPTYRETDTFARARTHTFPHAVTHSRTLLAAHTSGYSKMHVGHTCT